MSYLRSLCLSVYSSVQHNIMLCFCFVFLRLVYPMLPVSLCFSSSCVPCVASFSVFFFVLCILCCQFLCVFLRLVYPMLPVSLCFSSSCVPYVASFSGMSLLIAPSVFSNVYFICHFWISFLPCKIRNRFNLYNYHCLRKKNRPG